MSETTDDSQQTTEQYVDLDGAGPLETAEPCPETAHKEALMTGYDFCPKCGESVARFVNV
jgi:hypothetical protein